MIKNILYKIISFLVVIAVIITLGQSTGIFTMILVKAESVGTYEELFALIAAAQPGDVVELEKDYIGSRDGWGNSDVIVINKPLTIKSKAGYGTCTINYIMFEIVSHDITLENIKFEKSGVQPDGLFIGIGHEEYLSDLGYTGVYNLNIISCIFNTEFNPDGEGGRVMGSQIELRSGKDITITDCMFQNGTARYEGSALDLYDVSNIIIYNCTFFNNKVTEIGVQSAVTGDYYSGGYGGAVYLSESKNIKFTDCTFTQNSAQNAGAAVDAYKCENIVYDHCTFSNNYCTPQKVISYDIGGMGGAISIRKSDAKIRNSCMFDYNIGYFGGSVFALDSTVDIDNSTFLNNSTSYHTVVNPDAIRQIITIICGFVTAMKGSTKSNLESLSKKIVQTYLYKSVEDIPDADILIDIVKVCGSCLTRSQLDLDSYLSVEDLKNLYNKNGGEGGAIYSIQSDINISLSYFGDNSSEKDGGAITLISSDNKKNKAEITSSTFQGNHTNGNGGAVTNMIRNAIIKDCIFTSNNGYLGGALYNSTSATVSNSIFESNTAKTGGAVFSNLINNIQNYNGVNFIDNAAGIGGAIHCFGVDEYDGEYVGESCIININGCNFEQNGSLVCGGGVSVVNAELFISEETKFLENTSDETGGAIYLADKAHAEIKRTTFEGNSADKGGAIFQYDSKIILKRDVFLSNSSSSGAGAIHDEKGVINAVSCLFTGNYTESILSSNVVLNYDSDKLYLTNCTIAQNYFENLKVSSQIPAVAGSATNIRLRNNIFISNAKVNGTSIHDIILTSDNLDVKYNICKENGTGNIDNADLTVFKSANSNDYHLSNEYGFDNMMAVEQGVLDDVDPGAKDLDLNSRKVDNDGDGVKTVDFGAYEQQHLAIQYYDKHPDVEQMGVISGSIKKIILKGDSISHADVIVSPYPQYEFSHWETKDGKKINEGDSVNSSLWLYPVFTDAKDVYIYRYEPNKIIVECETDGFIDEISNTEHNYVQKVDKGSSGVSPFTEGINGYEFIGWNYWVGGTSEYPDAVGQYIAAVKAVNTFEFGSGGSYSTEKLKVFVSSTSEPDINLINTINTDTNFEGWSETPSGAIVTPEFGLEPKTYYAIYSVSIQPLKHQLEIIVDTPDDELETIITYQYDSGAVVDLNSLGISISDKYELIGFEDISGTSVTSVTMNTPVVVTANFGYVMHSLTVNVDGIGHVNGLEGEYIHGEIVTLEAANAVDVDGQSVFDTYISANGKVITKIIMSENRTITAVFDTVEYNVDFDTDGNGEIVSIMPEVYEYGSQINLDEIVLEPNEEYRFAAWYDHNGNEVSGIYTIEEDTSLVAIFELITFTLNVDITGNGTANEISGKYKEGTNLMLDSSLAVPDEGWEFVNFADENNNVISNIIIQSDQTIKAIFRIADNTVMLFNDIYEEPLVYENIALGSTIEEPAEPKKDNYVFKGWYKDSDYKNIWNFENDKVYYDMVLYAKWVGEDQKIVYSTETGDEYIEETHPLDKYFMLNGGTSFTRNNYLIEGWVIDSLTYELGGLFKMPVGGAQAKALWVEDNDNDGISDEDELFAGTDPNDPNDKPNKGNIIINILDVNGICISGITCRLNSEPILAETASNGRAIFNNISLSPHTLTIIDGVNVLGTYSLNFAKSNSNITTIIDNGETDSNGKVNTYITDDFMSLNMYIRQNSSGQWQLIRSETILLENPQTGDNRLNYRVLCMTITLLLVIIVCLILRKKLLRYIHLNTFK